jgi:2,5-diamino-6-(5-phospho-D-ribosylamino)pyrimidin-4(3H)-one isomerase/dehydratase
MKVKICGVTHPEDAEYAAHLGADYIGIIFADRSMRKVTLPVAKSIADVCRKEGAEPIAVFVDETAEQIASICEQTGIKTVQLHGAISQQALQALLGHYSIIYAISVEKKVEALPNTVIPLYDSEGGTGLSFDWMTFSPPQNRFWMLAGGLTADNVAEAIALLKPDGVDVATGVEVPHTRRKDPLLVKAFIQAAKEKI